MKKGNLENCVEGATNHSLHYRQRKFFKPLNAHWEYKQDKVFRNALKGHNLFIKAVPVYNNKEIHLFGSSTIESFWEYYDQLPKSERVHYEIIRAGKPCKAVIDLEWYTDVEGANSDEKFETIGKQLNDVFYKLKPDFDKSKIINACSTRFIEDKNKWKNSFHFIFPIVFQDIYVLKLFMNHYFTYDEIDTTIYTNNRAFRIIGSHKETDKSHTELSLIETEWNLETFKNSLASYTEGYGDIITYDILDKLLGINSNVTYSKQVKYKNTNIEIPESLKTFIDKELEDVELVERKDNLITLKNKSNRKCLITGEYHINNNAYLTISKDKVYYCCHGKECSGKSKLLGIFNNNKWNKTSFNYQSYKDILITKDNKQRLWDMTKYEEDVLFVCSEMGTGKSYQMKELYESIINKFKSDNKELLKHYNVCPPRACIITTRVAFAHSMMSLFPTFKLYTDEQFNPLIYDTIIQYESLHRLFDENLFDPFDLLIIDESESLLNNSICKTTNGENFMKNKEIFELLIKSSKKVYVSDAKMSDKSISAIHKIAPEKSKRVIINEYKNNDKHILLHNNYDNWLDQLKTYIRTGKKIAITTSSFSEGERIVETLFKTNKKLVDKWKFYHQDCDDKMMEDFHDINNVWNKLDYVIYTPKVTVGADFNVEHFDYIFSFAHPLSCPVETTFQMIGRIRKPKTPYVHLYVKEIKQTNLPLSYEDIKTEISTKKNTLNELYGIIDTKISVDNNIYRRSISDSWINNVYIYHQQEVNLSKTDYVRRFFDIAIKKGWDIYLAEKSVAIFDNKNEDFYDTKAPKSSNQLYESIDLEKFDHNKAEINKKYRNATSAQKMGLKKLYYDTNFPEIKTKTSYEFYKTMSKPNTNKIFKNSLSLLRGDDIADVMYDDLRHSDYIELSKHNAPILEELNKICKILKVESLLNTKTTVSTEQFETNYEEINKCISTLKIIMNIRTKNKGKQSQLKNLLDDINNILNNWIGAKFTKIKSSRRTRRINGKKKEFCNYHLDYKKIYQDNKQELSILDIVRKSMYYDEKVVI
jgi:hypothetical protein